jgi:hypothetical protein
VLSNRSFLYVRDEISARGAEEMTGETDTVRHAQRIAEEVNLDDDAE